MKLDQYRPSANDIVIWNAARWRVVIVKSGPAGAPPTLRLMKVVEVDASEVTFTGENIGTRPGWPM